jgi:hypothetical protein
LKQLVIKTPIVSASLTLRITDKFNKVYYVSKTADDQGKITVQLQDDNSDPLNPLTADLPTGLLNEYAGQFKLTLLDNNNSEKKWTISSIDYDALGFEVMNITPVMDTFTLDPTYLEGTVGQY